jgi:hypothetical protein
MDVLLTVIAVLGLGALLIAAWVFATAAKRYLSGEERRAELEALESEFSPFRREWTERHGEDRRQRPSPRIFPITVNGERIDQDRRVNPDRRRGAA